MLNIIIRRQIAADYPRITRLHDRVLGPGRFVKAAYMIREQAESADELNMVALSSDEEIAGVINFSHVSIDDKPGLLLGPIVVDTCFAGQGIGSALIRRSCDLSNEYSYNYIVLIGDLAYYGKFGFRQTPAIILPAPCDDKRVLLLAHRPEYTKLSGLLKGVKISH